MMQPDVHIHLFEALAVSCGGDNSGYMLKISCRSVAVVPKECQRIGAKSGKASRCFDNSSSAVSRVSSRDRSATSCSKENEGHIRRMAKIGGSR